MAREVVICEALCFICNNFDKLTAGQLKPVLSTFYGDEDLFVAKEILLKAVTNAVEASGCDAAASLPRLPKRQGDNKGKQTADDILKLYTIVDEQKLFNVMPRFVAADMKRIPFVNVDSMNVVAMARKLESLEHRMNAFEQFVISSSCTDKIVQPNDHVQLATDKISLQKPVSSVDTMVTNEGHLQESDIADDEQSHDSGSWVQVAYNNRRRLSKTNQAGTQRAPQPVQQSSHQQKKQQKVLGTCVTDKSSVKSGVVIKRKAVLHVDNLDPQCTGTALTEFLKAGGIDILSCHESKSWLRGTEKDQVAAYRVCVPAAHRSLMLDAELWAEGIIVRDWKFKQTKNGGQSST